MIDALDTAHTLSAAINQGTVTKSDISDLKGTINLLAWMVGINITLTLLVLGKLLLSGHQ